MSELVWQDTTYYESADQNKVADSWTLDVNKSISLTVCRLHGREDTWFLSINGLDMVACDIGTDDLEQAKAVTITVAITKLKMVAESLLTTIDDLTKLI